MLTLLARTFLAFTVCCSCTRAVAQKDQDTSLTRAVDAYLTCARANDYQCMFDRLHPALFKLVPKEVMLEKVKEQAAEQGIETRIEDLKVTDLRKPIEHDGGRFSRVDYTSRIVLKVTDETNEDGTPMTDEEKKDADAFMLEMFETLYGKGQVKHHAAEREFAIQRSESVFAIREKDASDWLFISNKEGMDKLLEGVVPKEVLKKLK